MEQDARSDWDLAVSTGMLRIVVGAVLLRWRRPLARLLGADGDDRTMVRLLAYFGIRDLTLGVGALAASRPGGNVDRQVLLQGAADATDTALVGAAIARGHLPRVRGGLAAATAVGSAAVEFATALRRR